MADSKRFYVLTGGTMIHVAPHFSLCAPAYGRVGVDIHAELARQLRHDPEREVVLIRTKMAIGAAAPSEHERELFKHAGLPCLETNDDLAKLVARPDTACIVLACAVCDWQPESLTQKWRAARCRWIRQAGHAAREHIAKTCSWSASRRRPG